MDHSSYLRVLLSVWVGLGLGQLVQAFNRLARFKGPVKWDWLPLVWAAFAFLMVVQTWWAYFDLLQSRIWVNLFAFLLPLIVFVILYLICASALPDLTKATEATSVDLEAFHFGQRRYFFGLWGVLLFLAIVVTSVVRGRLDLIGADGYRLAGVAAAVAMALSQKRAVHAVITWLAIATMGLYITLFSLRLS